MPSAGDLVSIFEVSSVYPGRLLQRSATKIDESEVLESRTTVIRSGRLLSTDDLRHGAEERDAVATPTMMLAARVNLFQIRLPG